MAGVLPIGPGAVYRATATTVTVRAALRPRSSRARRHHVPGRAFHASGWPGGAGPRYSAPATSDFPHVCLGLCGERHARLLEEPQHVRRPEFVDVAPGPRPDRIHLDGYKGVTLERVVHPEEPVVLLAPLEHRLGPEPGQPWTNSLGMKFVPVGAVRFCGWETRVWDYAAFCADTGRAAAATDFPQGDDHPVVLVDWQDAMDFCAWLTAKERREVRLNDRQCYRLSTDREWSETAGLPAENGATPEARDGFFTGSSTRGEGLAAAVGRG